MVDWSGLDVNLLAEIVVKLDAIEDFVYFADVSRSWNHASSLVKRKWKPSVPYLLLTENLKENPKFLRKIFSLNNSRRYQLSLPQSFGARCWGSAFGWVVTLDLDRQIRMFNPFTEARFQLPPQTTFPDKELPLDNEIIKHIIRQIFIQKAIVVRSLEWGRDDDWIVLAIHSYGRMILSFARPGDQTWTKIVPPWPWPVGKPPYDVPFSHRAIDIVCSDRLILVLYKDASLGYLDISDLSKSTNLQQTVKAKEFLPSPEVLKGCLRDYYQGMYLVESFGNLLIVLRNGTNPEEPNSQAHNDDFYETVGFEVFGFNFEMKIWEQVRELGEVALFLGSSHSMSVRTSESRNCKSNCIYFTDDNCGLWDHPKKGGGHDMGIFELENGEIQKFYRGDDVHSRFCTPFWFMPQI